jgi:hypothetical protein
LSEQENSPNSLAWPPLQEDKQADSLHFSILLECPRNEALCSTHDHNSSEVEDTEGSQTIPGTPEHSDFSNQLSSSTTLFIPRKRKER